MGVEMDEMDAMGEMDGLPAPVGHDSSGETGASSGTAMDMDMDTDLLLPAPPPASGQQQQQQQTQDQDQHSRTDRSPAPADTAAAADRPPTAAKPRSSSRPDRAELGPIVNCDRVFWRKVESRRARRPVSVSVSVSAGAAKADR
ncbi:hypothetical protein KEM52_004708, partial [Ascosphaera acerosa]